MQKGYPTKFNELFIGNALEQFCEYALEKEDAIIEKKTSLVEGIPNLKQTTIPNFIHGDCVEFQERDQLMVWSWGPLLCQACSLETNMLIGAIPKSCTSEETWAPLMELLVWSFQALLMGVHPTVDHLGRPLGKGSSFDLVKGQQLTHQGYKSVTWPIQGDHDIFQYFGFTSLEFFASLLGV